MENGSSKKPILILNRREFLWLTAGMTAITGCQTGNEGGGPESAAAPHVVNAGPAARYAAQGVYSNFREQGFFVIRRGEKLVALSAICTHKRCKLQAESDHTFYCKCHGSTFDPGGKVTNGPAKRDLPEFATAVDAQGQLLVTVAGR